MLRDWLADNDGHRLREWLDPAAGDGAIISAMRGHPAFAKSTWAAIEIDARHCTALREVSTTVTIDDALSVSWPYAGVVMNPPFVKLDEFWSRAVAHRDFYGVPVAALMPVAWWNAEKRADYVAPDVIIALSWRPTFHGRTGLAHKGSQDFLWSVLAPVPLSTTTWIRAKKPVIGVC